MNDYEKIIIYVIIFVIIYLIFRNVRGIRSEALIKSLTEIGGQNIAYNITYRVTKVTGDLDGRKFEIDQEFQGRFKGHDSWLTLSSTYSRPTSTVFSQGFFEGSPDWDAVSEELKAPSYRREGSSEQYRKKYSSLITSLNRQYGPIDEFLTGSELRVQAKQIVLHYPGLISGRAAKMLQIMKGFAVEFEKLKFVE